MLKTTHNVTITLFLIILEALSLLLDNSRGVIEMPYIPKIHKKYNLLPFSRKNGGEVFSYPCNLEHISINLRNYFIITQKKSF